MRHTLSVLVENKPGVLTRIASLFGRRAYNIDSLTVAETERPELSRMTIVARGQGPVIEQIQKQLYKQINVLKVSTLAPGSSIERELCLVKVHTDAESRAAVTEIASIFRARIVDVAPRSLVVEATGDRDKVDAIIANLRPFGIKEVVRSGPVALTRGATVLQGSPERSSDGRDSSALGRSLASTADGPAVAAQSADGATPYAAAAHVPT